MPSVYTPNAANNPTAYTVPADGDNANVASVLTGLEAVMDKAAYIGAMFKMAAIATSSTIVTSSVTTAYVTAVTATFATPISILATDVIAVIGTTSWANGASTVTTTYHSVLTYNGGLTRQLDSVDTYAQGAATGYVASPYTWAGTTSAATNATSVSISIKTLSSSATAQSATLFVAVLRAG